MGKSEYYFMRKNSQEKYFPCRVINQLSSSWDEVENLETGEKEDRIHNYYKTEIDVRLEKRAQQINSFIEKKGVVLYTFNLILVDGLKETHKIFTFLARKDELEKIVKNLTIFFIEKKGTSFILLLEGDNSKPYLERFTEDGLERIVKNLINFFIEKKGTSFILLLGDNNSDLSKERLTFLDEKDDQEKNEKALKEIGEKGNKKSDFYDCSKKLNYVITIEDLFEVLKKKYNIILSPEEKKNIILKLDKPREDN